MFATRRTLVLPIFCALLMQAGVASAHYPILVGDQSPIIANKNDTISFTYGRGHLHVPEWTEAPEPDWVKAYSFFGAPKDLSGNVQTDGLTLKLDYRVRAIGDTWIVFHLPQIWSVHDLGWTETTVRTIIHRDLYRGWKKPIGLPLEMVPLTRPYGVLPGDAFRVQLLSDGKPLAGANIVAEKYHAPPLKEPFPRDPIITRAAQTGPMGTATLTLNSSGWWVLFASHDKGELEKDGKSGTITTQDAMWVYVEPKQP